MTEEDVKTDTEEETVETDEQDFILTKKRFSRMVEEYVSYHPDSSYMDAVLEVCQEKSIDPHDIASLICKSIKEKIEAEAMRNNLVKGGRKDQELPI